MVDSFINPEKMIGAIYLTYYDQGDLTGYVKKESGTPIANDITWNIFTNICAALAYCHHGIRSPHDDANPPPTWSAIIHRDIKTDNIFLQSNPTAPGNIIAILGDFGKPTPILPTPHSSPDPTPHKPFLANPRARHYPRLVNQPLPRAHHLPPPHRRQQRPLPGGPAVAAAREPAVHHG
ncbi:ATPase-like ParA/MinD [Lasiodiplodia theobromae]|nr:ATPase-like ParA/MinD [Lasiodiplodia theobromae]